LLNPEIISEDIIAKTFVSKVYYFEQIDSTNSFAKSRNIPDGSLVLTNFQEKGRGRYHRTWETDAGKNLTFTISKKFNIDVQDQFIINCCVSYSIFKVISSFIQTQGLDLSLKWPNDVLLNGRKLAGVLIEKRNRSDNYIIGIGININHRNFNKSIAEKATSLGIETGKEYNINEILVKIIETLDYYFSVLEKQKHPEIFKLWKKNNKYIGREIAFIDDSTIARTGYLQDVKISGEIIIDENGKKSSFTAGEILFKI